MEALASRIGSKWVARARFRTHTQGTPIECNRGERPGRTYVHSTHKYLFHMAACLRLQVRERKFRAQLVEQIT